MKLLLGFALVAIPVAFFFGVWLGMKLTDQDIRKVREYSERKAEREARW